jgi:hypothetical protein
MPAGVRLIVVALGITSLAVARPAELGGTIQPQARAIAVRFPSNAIQVQLAGNSTVQDASTTVCSVQCDTLDPSKAQQDTFPVPVRIQNGRQIRLHISDPDAMGWASIDAGTQGDSIWIDRSWDGGATWDGLLGKASIPASLTGTRTLMYNLVDPRNHRRGMIRACGDATGVECTDWVHMQACDLNGVSFS